MATSPKQTRPAGRPVCMLTHSYFDEDARVRREAQAIVERGRPVDVFCLRRPGDVASAVVDGALVRRLDVQRHQGAGLLTYLREYASFMLRASVAATRAHRRRRYAVVQVHTLPDFLIAASVPLRLKGVPVILDLHEAMPEFFRSRFPRAASRPAHAILLLQERLSIAMADRALTVNEAMANRLVRLGVPARKLAVIPNGPVLKMFDAGAHPSRPFMADGALRLVYAGALTPIYEIDVVLDALVELRQRRPELRTTLEVFGRGDSEPALRERAERASLAGQVTFHGRIALDAVPGMIAAGDIGVAPTRRDRFTDFSLSTKIFEYAAMGKPVVATRLPMVEETFPAGTVSTYEPGDSTSLADAIQGLVDDPAERESRIARTLAIVRDAAWERFADRYAAIIEDLAADGRTGTGTIQEATAVMTTGPADATDAPANATVGATVEQV